MRLRMHEAVHTGERPFACIHCDSSYRREVHLKKHNRRCHRDKISINPLRSDAARKKRDYSSLAENATLLLTTTYKCHLCAGVSFDSMKEWVLHHGEAHEQDLGYGDVTLQEQVKPLDGLVRPCPHCGKMKQSNYVMLNHIKSVHLNIRPFSCNMCQRQFSSKAGLKTHTDTMHADAPPQFLCTLCGVSLKSKGSMELHEKTHFDQIIKRFDCEICKSKFGSKHLLSNHIASTHSEERPFTCDVCGARFKIKRVLSQHKRKVHEKKFILDEICEFCSKGYAFKALLKEHLMSVHKLTKEAAGLSAGVKPKLFRVLPNGDRIVKEKETKPKTCGFCGRAYVRREQLFTHLVSVHAQTQEQAKDITGLESKRNLFPSPGTGNRKRSTRKKLLAESTLIPNFDGFNSIFNQN